MPACEECYRSKKSCDREQQNRQCSRCARLGVPCVARISRQGQGPKKRPRNSLNEKIPCTKGKNPGRAPSEDCDVLEDFLRAPSSIPSSPKFHFGLRYIVHSWSSFALARRSFQLLERACRLATKCEILMDDIFCPARQNIVQPILYNQNIDSQNDSHQEIPLRWEDIPPSLRDFCRLNSLENRYIMIRQAKNGQSHYLASDKFQQKIASVWQMEQAWKTNETPVIQLFLQGPTDFAKFTKAIHYQMASYVHPTRHQNASESMGSTSCLPTTGHRPPGTRGGQFVQEMDLIYAFEILTLEHSFYVCELVFPQPTIVAKKLRLGPNKSPSPSAGDTEIPVEMCAPGIVADSSDDHVYMFDNLLPLDEELHDDELAAILALIDD